MSDRIFILIETESGRSQEVYAALKQLQGITVELVTQPYDIIVIADAKTNEDGGRLSRKIEPISGVIRTVVCRADESALIGC
jgi:nitrate reductase NapAB chaperone NapD